MLLLKLNCRVKEAVITIHSSILLPYTTIQCKCNYSVSLFHLHHGNNYEDRAKSALDERMQDLGMQRIICCE